MSEINVERIETTICPYCEQTITGTPEVLMRHGIQCYKAWVIKHEFNNININTDDKDRESTSPIRQSFPDCQNNHDS